MTLEKINYKEWTGDGLKFETTIYACGRYNVRKVAQVSDDGSRYEYFTVNPGEQQYNAILPSIYYSDGFGKGEREFTINTTAYGALKPDLIQMIVEGYQEALAVVETLTKEFC